MERRLRNLGLSLLSLALVSGVGVGATAQTVDGPSDQATQDWVLSRFPDRKAVVAVAAFDGALTFAARCVDGAYDIVIDGLPPVEAGTVARVLRLAVGDDVLRPGAWTVGEADSAFSRIPAIHARQLAAGGQVQVAVPGADGRPGVRYVMALEPSGAALEETLAACGKPLVDPRYDAMIGDGGEGLPDALVWTRQPQPSFPAPVRGRSPTLGYVTTSCRVTHEGALDDCEVESEKPRGYNLGRAVLRSLEDARVRSANGADPSTGDRLILFTTGFTMN